MWSRRAGRTPRHRCPGAETTCLPSTAAILHPPSACTSSTPPPPAPPDRFAEWAPRLVGDVAAIDAWWRSQDPTRTPRFDLHTFGCDSAFGSLDLSRVPLSASITDVRGAYTRVRELLGTEHGFRQAEKVYLVYFDGPTGQTGRERICGEADEGRRGLSGMAIVYLDSCGASDGDDVRVIVAAHELMHTLGAVDGRSRRTLAPAVTSATGSRI